MGAYADLDIAAEIAAGFEPEENLGAADTDATQPLVKAAKRALRSAWRPVVLRLVRRAGTDEEAFYDTVAGEATTADARDALDEGLAYAFLSLLFQSTAHEPGAGEHDAMRARHYRSLLREHGEGFAEMVEAAMDEDEITFTATRSESSGAPVWAT